MLFKIFESGSDRGLESMVNAWMSREGRSAFIEPVTMTMHVYANDLRRARYVLALWYERHPNGKEEAHEIQAAVHGVENPMQTVHEDGFMTGPGDELWAHHGELATGPKDADAGV